jgi:hypothetical protein
MGSSYSRRRHILSHLGRWNTRDPLWHPEGPSAYEYARGNPLGRLDPYAEWSFSFYPDVVKGFIWMPKYLLDERGERLQARTRLHGETGVQCRCVPSPGSGNKCIIDCDVRLWFSVIEIDPEACSQAGVDKKLVYGHEQRHILSMKTEGQGIYGWLKNRAADIGQESPTQCDFSSGQLEAEAGGKIALAWDREKDHQNPNSPPEATGFRPLGSVFPEPVPGDIP